MRDGTAGRQGARPAPDTGCAANRQPTQAPPPPPPPLPPRPADGRCAETASVTNNAGYFGPASGQRLGAARATRATTRARRGTGGRGLAWREWLSAATNHGPACHPTPDMPVTPLLSSRPRSPARLLRASPAHRPSVAVALTLVPVAAAAAAAAVAAVAVPVAAPPACSCDAPLCRSLPPLLARYIRIAALAARSPIAASSPRASPSPTVAFAPATRPLDACQYLPSPSLAASLPATRTTTPSSTASCRCPLLHCSLCAAPRVWTRPTRRPPTAAPKSQPPHPPPRLRLRLRQTTTITTPPSSPAATSSRASQRTSTMSSSSIFYSSTSRAPTSRRSSLSSSTCPWTRSTCAAPCPFPLHMRPTMLTPASELVPEPQSQGQAGPQEAAEPVQHASRHPLRPPAHDCPARPVRAPSRAATRAATRADTHESRLLPRHR